MAAFGDSPAAELQPAARAELEEVLDAELVEDDDDDSTGRLARAPAQETRGEVAERNLFALGERLAARAATPATRRQYASIYSTFATWLSGELGRPARVDDVDSDSIAAWGRHLERAGGRHGGPAAPSTRRIYLSMARALLKATGREDEAAAVRVPRHRAGPPETLTDADYSNLLRVPDRRSVIGKRDHALLRVLGDCGLRSAELRGLIAQDVRRPRSNARHHRLYVRGKGGTEREVPIPEATQAALEAWLKVHPLARGHGLRDHEPIFVRLGPRPDSQPPEPLSPQAVFRLVTRRAQASGLPQRLSHPHALRAYWATSLLEAGVPIHTVSARLGHADLRTTSRYAADRPEHVDDIADVLDRRAAVAARAGR